MRSEAAIQQLAAHLLAAYDDGRLIERPTVHGELDLGDAYRVGASLTALRRARGERTVGRKIGFTNRALWPAYGVDRPLWAHVYEGTVRYARNGAAKVALAGMVAPRIEPEIVLGIGSPIDPATTDLADPIAILRHVAWIAAGFEIVDCHFAGWQFTSAECAADFGLHARLIIGEQTPCDPQRLDALEDAVRTCRLTLSCDGELREVGVGANALGSPALALGYLAATLAAQGAEPVAAGEVVTTGTLTAALPIAPGATWRSQLEGIALAPLSVTLTD
jgi:2-oxo-3-hexenedioate decarboxylase